ncbi:restriction endonuclease subunit S [uncultured Psychrobacter sp.]|uniref:restriction endonuclease subunit S n=1 Tax=uncultured Psychrobacter sp. TaxID=259303 RepID=UPI003459176D
MAKFKTYEKYTYSDYFKAELPEGWMEKSLNHISAYDKNSFVDGPFGSDLKSSDYKESGIPLIQLNNIREGKHVLQNYKFINEKKRVELSRHVALPNDIIIAKMAEPVARSAIVSDKYPEYVIVADCVKLSPDLSLINLSFLNWAINSDLVKMNAELVSSGTTRIRISLGELKKLKIPYPSLIEQKKIANFLDYQTAKIDTLIDKQQTLIQLLKEKRQAVISHAVTKGLNPDVPMKDSGVEWLGDVPEHWELVPLKYLCNFSGGGTPTKDNLSYWTGGTIPWVSPKDMKSFWIDKTQDYITENAVKESSTKLVKAGSLLMVVRSGILQRTIPIAINTVDVTMNQDMRALQFNERMTSEYAANYIVGNVDKLLFTWSKDGATVESIEQEYLSNSLFPVPPIDEQNKIVDEINDQMKIFDTLILKAQEAIQLMQERRTALISAAVTGKIDVRGWEEAQ